MTHDYKRKGTTTLFSALKPERCGKSDEVPDLTDSFFARRLPLAVAFTGLVGSSPTYGGSSLHQNIG